MYTKESLILLREKIDLIELLSGHVDLKRAGSVYKALCPFHQEKNPSFVVQKGAHHYHCFGCGAHGDAIQFLMTHLNFTFVEAIESLAERFHVTLQRIEKQEEEGINRTALKETCRLASAFFHTYLLYSEEGQEALRYLYKRGITLDFLRRFEVGLAPAVATSFKQAMHQEKISEKMLIESGLWSSSKGPFFRDRITFPIRNAAGVIVGFSARVYREKTTGGKYINTPETPLFKKSRILFGLNFCRKRIVKERRVVLVEGQIDCLKLIEGGLNLTVASLGTAFGESHVEELQHLGVRQAYLLFDGDLAGKTAASKVGDLLQAVGIEVFVPQLPLNTDPDSYMNQHGMEGLLEILGKALPYLAFQVEYLSATYPPHSPAGKAELVKEMRQQIEKWTEPVLVHESLKQLAILLQIPEETLGLKQPYLTRFYTKKTLDNPLTTTDFNRVLELDLIRWLILMGEEKIEYPRTARHFLRAEHFWTPACWNLFQKYLQAEEEKTPCDLLSLGAGLEEPQILDEILHKKVNRARAAHHFLETIQKLLERQWHQTCEGLKMQLAQEGASPQLTQQLAELLAKRPQVDWISDSKK